MTNDTKALHQEEVLLPCPFCGGDAHWPEPDVNIHYVGCKECSANAQNEVLWNIRTPRADWPDRSADVQIEGSIYDGISACLVRDGKTIAHVVRFNDSLEIADALNTRIQSEALTRERVATWQPIETWEGQPTGPGHPIRALDPKRDAEMLAMMDYARKTLAALQSPAQSNQPDQVREAISAALPFMRHDGLCGVIGGYNQCTCGMEAARAALSDQVREEGRCRCCDAPIGSGELCEPCSTGNDPFVTSKYSEDRS